MDQLARYTKSDRRLKGVPIKLGEYGDNDGDKFRIIQPLIVESIEKHGQAAQ